MGWWVVGFVGLVILWVSLCVPLSAIAMLFVICCVCAFLLHSTLPLPVWLIFCLFAAARIFVVCIVIPIYSAFAAVWDPWRRRRDVLWLEQTQREEARCRVIERKIALGSLIITQQTGSQLCAYRTKRCHCRRHFPRRPEQASEGSLNPARRDPGGAFFVNRAARSQRSALASSSSTSA
jgi:hypothetical protein